MNTSCTLKNKKFVMDYREIIQISVTVTVLETAAQDKMTLYTELVKFLKLYHS